MPFQETCALAERIAVLKDYETGVFTISELARRYGVSRETIYVWKRRREAGDGRWFEDRSHAPVGCPHATPSRQAAAVIATRERFPHFGPKKIAAWLAHRPQEDRGLARAQAAGCGLASVFDDRRYLEACRSGNGAPP